MIFVYKVSAPDSDTILAGTTSLPLSKHLHDLVKAASLRPAISAVNFWLHKHRKTAEIFQVDCADSPREADERVHRFAQKNRNRCISVPSSISRKRKKGYKDYEKESCIYKISCNGKNLYLLAWRDVTQCYKEAKRKGLKVGNQATIDFLRKARSRNAVLLHKSKDWTVTAELYGKLITEDPDCVNWDHAGFAKFRSKYLSELKRVHAVDSDFQFSMPAELISSVKRTG